MLLGIVFLLFVAIRSTTPADGSSSLSPSVAFWILSSPGHLGAAAPIRVYQNNRVAQNKTLSAQSEAAIDKLRGFQEGRLQASEVFDIDLMAKYLAIVDLWKLLMLWKHTIFVGTTTL